MQPYNEHEYIAFAFSALLHFILAYLFFFGLPPSFYKNPPEEQVIIFEMLPVKDIINIPKQSKQQEDENKETESKQAPRNKEPEKPIEKIEPKSETPIAKEPEPAQPEIIPEKPITEEKKIPPPIITPPIENKPEIKQEPKPIKDKKPNKPTDLDSLLKNLEKSSTGNKEKVNSKVKAVKNDTSDIDNLLQSFNDESPLSITEKSLIKAQIQKHWHPPLGGHNAYQIRITYHIEFNSDGSVLKATLKHKDCAGTNANLCEAFASSAERAIWQASPIENLPIARYNSWQKLNFNFDPSDLLK